MISKYFEIIASTLIIRLLFLSISVVEFIQVRSIDRDLKRVQTKKTKGLALKGWLVIAMEFIRCD